MKKSFFNYFLFLFIVIYSEILGGCSAISYIQGNTYLTDLQYEKAAAKFKECLSSTNNPFFTMECAHNTGVAYFYIGNYEEAIKYHKIGINAYPSRGYYGYLGLSEIYYKNGNLDEAYLNIMEAKKLVNYPTYYENEKKSAYDIDLLKNYVTAFSEYLEMRILLQNLYFEYESGNYNKSIDIANTIINKEYHFQNGIGVNGNTISSIVVGSIADINGLIEGDKILKINNIKMENSTEDVFNELNKYYDKYGDSINITVLRGKREIQLVCKLIYPEIEEAKNILYNIEKRANLDRKAETLFDRGPLLKIIDPKPMRGVKIQESNSVKFRILGSDIDFLKSVTVNGIECKVAEPDLLEKTMLPGKVRKYILSMPIFAGENQFEVLATSLKGKTFSKIITIEQDNHSGKDIYQIYQHRVAVVIGINKYYSWPNLECAVNDAIEIKNWLKKMGFDHIIELYDQEATRERILRILSDTLPGIMGPDDCLLVYFAGHGATEELSNGGQEGYIIPVNADRQNYRGTAISMSSIRDFIKRYRAKHKLFIFDSCYSGLGLTRSGMGFHPGNFPSYIKSMAQKPVSFIMTAGGKNEQAIEEKGHGSFTQALLDSFDTESKLIDDKYFLASDIAQEVRKKVHDQSEGKQVPQYGVLSGEGDFIFEIF